MNEYEALDVALDYLNEGLFDKNGGLTNKNKSIDGTFYVGSTNKIKLGDTNINNRTYFYKNFEDCIYSLVERLCSKTSEPYSEVISIDLPKKLNTKVHVASVKGVDAYWLGHGACSLKSYEVDEIIYDGTIKDLIKKYNIKTK